MRKDNGRDMLLRQLEKADIENIITIVGFGAEKVEEVVGDRTKFALQNEQLGTGHSSNASKGSFSGRRW